MSADVNNGAVTFFRGTADAASDKRPYHWHAPRPTQYTTKKLWVAAIDLNAPAGSDPSHPAFYLPAQELLAGNASRIADGEPPVEPTAPKGDATFAQPMSLARVHQYLSMATPLLWTRQPDTIGVVGLALNACDERNGRVEELEQIKELLTTARDLWRALPEVEDERDRIATSRTTFRLIHLADILAVTSGA